MRLNVKKRGKKEMREKLICALLFGEAETEKKAKRIARTYQNCPYINFMATKENQLFATFFLPERQRWWIEYVGKKPKETLELEKAEITIVDVVKYPKQLKIRLPKKLQKFSPCGSNCGICPTYEKCLGCPATIFYKHAPHNEVSCK